MHLGNKGSIGAKGFDVGVATIHVHGDKPLELKHITGLHPYDGADINDGSIATDISGYPQGMDSLIYGMTGESE